MNNIYLFKVLLLIVFVLLISLYLFIVINKYNDTDTDTDTMNTNAKIISLDNFTIRDEDDVMTKNIQSQIAQILNVSQSRITNIIYHINEPSQNTSDNIIFITFTILNSTNANDTNTDIIYKQALALFASDTFIIRINYETFKLKQFNSDTRVITKNLDYLSKYFNNYSLNKIADYANNKYTNVYNDPRLTQFYKLQYDKNYNIIPVLT